MAEQGSFFFPASSFIPSKAHVVPSWSTAIITDFDLLAFGSSLIPQNLSRLRNENIDRMFLPPPQCILVWRGCHTTITVHWRGVNRSQGSIICCSGVSQATVLPVSHMIAELGRHVTAISRQQNETRGEGVLMNKSLMKLRHHLHRPLIICLIWPDFKTVSSKYSVEASSVNFWNSTIIIWLLSVSFKRGSSFFFPATRSWRCAGIWSRRSVRLSVRSVRW